MHRIDGPGHVGNLFVAGDPTIPQQPTIVTPDWANAVQEEIVAVIESAGLTLDKLDNTQLNQALSGRGLFRNHAMNGLMNVAQRYPRSVVKQFFGVSGETGYVVDRWLCDPGSTGVVSVSWIDVDLLAHSGNDQPGLPLVDGKFPAYLNFALTSPSGAVRVPTIRQRIPDVRTLAGETVTLSFYARLTLPIQAGFDQFSMELRQDWGTGGTPSPDTVYTSPTFEILQSFATWSRYSFTTTLGQVQGKSFGTNDDSVLEIRLNLGDGGETFPLQITGIQLEKGTAPGLLEAVPFDVDLDRCLAHYEQSFAYGETFAAPPNYNGAAFAYDGSTDPSSLATRFRREKATTPTVTWSNPQTGAANSVRWAATNYALSSPANPSRAGTGTPGTTTHGASPELAAIHWTAEAEL